MLDSTYCETVRRCSPLILHLSGYNGLVRATSQVSTAKQRAENAGDSQAFDVVRIEDLARTIECPLSDAYRSGIVPIPPSDLGQRCTVAICDRRDLLRRRRKLRRNRARARKGVEGRD